MADISRLARLARVREVERHRAAEAAASSGGRHGRLHQLAERSRQLAEDYAARGDACDGAGLAALFAFRSEVAGLSLRAAGDAEVARQAADGARAALAVAQRRRDLVEDRLGDAHRAKAERTERAPPELARSLNGRSRSASPAARNRT